MNAQSHGRTGRGVLAVCVAGLLSVAQMLPGGQAAQAPTKLNIVIVEGEEAINNVRQRTAREVIVQVEDENNRPLAGAAVYFLLPESGPGASFPGGARSLTVMTDQKGRAVAAGLRNNNVAGKFQIRVEASYQNVTATTTINQANAVLTAGAAAGVSGKVIAALAVAGGAAAAGAVAAMSGGKNGGNGAPPAPTRPPTTITPGTPTVSGPR